MKKSDAVKIFRSIADVPFKECGFKYYRKREAYRKVGERFVLLCHCRCIDSGSVLIEPSFSLRCPEIEDIFHDAVGTQQRFRDMTSVLWPTAEVLVSGDSFDFHYPATTEEEVIAAANGFLKLHKEKGEEFFIRHSDLPSIESVLNDTPEEHCLYQPSVLHRCCFGLIAASILELSTYQELASQYESILSSYSGGFYLPQYRKLINDLRNKGVRCPTYGGHPAGGV